MCYNRDIDSEQSILVWHYISFQPAKKESLVVRCVNISFEFRQMSFKINMSSRYIKITTKREDSISSATHINRILQP